MVKGDLVLIGGGGHCKSCIDVIETHGQFKISGIVDAPARRNEKVLGYSIIGSDEDLPALMKTHRSYLVTIGSIKDPKRRIECFDQVKTLGGQLPTIVSPLAHVSKHSRVKEGTIILHHAVINPNANIGANCIINTFALIEHDAQVGDHCHVSTGSIVNGTSRIGNRVFLGSNSVVGHNLTIADDVVIGAGAVVVRSIDEIGVYVGNPARRLRS